MSDDLIPILKLGEKFNESKQAAEADNLSQYRQIAGSVVQIEGSGAGSGFAYGAPGQIITNFHVVVDSPEVFVRTQDGSRYRARITKADDIKDLALLKIEGKAPDYLKPLPLGNDSTLKSGAGLSAFGHPKGSRLTFISPGFYESDTTNRQRLSTDAIRALKLIPGTDTEKSEFLQNRLLHANIHVEKGSSGGPLLDSYNKVVGVTVYKDHDNDANAYFVPSSDLSNFLSAKEKFQFKYEYQPSSELGKFMHENPLLSSGIAAGLAYKGLSQLAKPLALSRGLSGGIAAYGALGLLEDIPRLSAATNNRDLLIAGLHTAGDSALFAGGLSRAIWGSSSRALTPTLSSTLLRGAESQLATTIGGGLIGSGSSRIIGNSIGAAGLSATESYLTRAGKAGLILIAAGVTAKIVADLIPDKLVNTQVLRTDGSRELPFYLGRELKAPLR